MMKLSKSDYVLGCSCPKALWLKKHRKDLYKNDSGNFIENGYDIQNLACQLYPEGIMINAEPWEVSKGAKETQKLSREKSILFEAVAELPCGAFCRADILQKSGQGWNLIEIKSTNSIHPEHIDDLAFQHFVFSKAGYQIKKHFILHLNKDYIRGRNLDISSLFKTEDVTLQVLHKQTETAAQFAQLYDLQNQKQEPCVFVDKNCLNCEFYAYCGKNIPEYSILNIFRADKIKKIYEQNGSYEVEKLDLKKYDGTNAIDIQAWQNKEIIIDKQGIRDFLQKLVYPLYYLDYETIMPAIPLFEGSRPYQQIPFQFSLHIQKKQGGECKHTSFLHKQKTDPRRALAEFLIQSCGKKGSIIVYNANFEKSRNKELAEMFPDLAENIHAVNDRIVDELIPFRSRFLYHYLQQSSASIKKVLPAFTSLSYDELDIHNGNEAMEGYLDFIEGNLTLKEEQNLFQALETYCGQDTYAMVLLMDVLYKYSK